MEILRSFSAYRFILAIQRIFLLTTPTLSDFFLFRQTAQSAAPYWRISGIDHDVSPTTEEFRRRGRRRFPSSFSGLHELVRGDPHG